MIKALKVNQDFKKTFTKYVSFNVLSMVGLSCYILADTFFIANGIGSEGLTALNLVMPVFILINAFSLMLGIGGAACYSIAMGRGDKAEAQNTYSQTVTFALFIGILYTVFSVALHEPLIILLGADEVILAYAKPYLLTLMSFAWAFMIDNVLIAFVRNDQNPNLAMVAMLSGSFSNIILDYVFIYLFEWGMFGAAIATCMSPIISMLILSHHWLSKKSSLKLKKALWQLKTIKQIGAIGIPTFVTEFSSGLIIMVFNFIILKLSGNLGVAAFGIIANLAIVVMAVFTGVAQGIQPIVSFNYGAGRLELVKKAHKYGMVVALCFGVAAFLTGLIFAEGIANLFNKDNDPLLTEMAAYGIKIYFSAFLFMGLNIVNIGYLAAITSAKTAFILSMLRGFILAVPLALILAWLVDMTGVWLAVLGGELITFLISLKLAKEPKPKRLKSIQ